MARPRYDGRMRRATVLCLFGMALLACSAKKPSTADSGAIEEPDTGAADPDAGGCPAPPSVAPADVAGKGFLAPVTVTYVRTVDGDTAHFVLPPSSPLAGERTFRFLYVNTEEASGTAQTAFGVATVPVVRGWLEAAKEIQVAMQDDGTGKPNADPYMRLLTLVFVDGALLQTRIVREGYSAYYALFGCPASPTHESLLWAEAEAFGAKRGIWAPGHPTDYRPILSSWNVRGCRPNPFEAPYCP